MAAHAADAYARLTRTIGVAIVTAGPGVTDAVTGVANAHAARSPLLLIGGAAPLGLRGLGALQEMEQVALLRPITKGAFTVAETRQIPEVLTTAIRTALSGRPGPVFVEIPVDLLMTTVEARLAPFPAATSTAPRRSRIPTPSCVSPTSCRAPSVPSSWREAASTGTTQPRRWAPSRSRLVSRCS